MNRKIALRALRNLCTFVGAIALISYFGNFAVDLRHWYVTLASAFVCSVLWFGFYLMEQRGGFTQVLAGFSRPRTSSSAELQSPAESAIPTVELPASSEPQVTTPNPLPWLKPHVKKVAGAK